MTASSLANTASYAAAEALIRRKAEIEEQLASLERFLSSQNGVGMQGPLVDSEGFPRTDIDVPGVRETRVRVIELRNDLTEVMTQAEKAIHAVHAETRESRACEMECDTAGVASGSSEGSSIQPAAFAVVNAVAPDSPAKSAGLMKGDEILRFGHVHAGNHNRLQALNEIVAASENKTLDVTVRRAGAVTAMQVTPSKSWGGRGLLGCHILPIK